MSHPVYRALVTYSNVGTGEIRVKIPSIIGMDSEVSISYIGRKKDNGEWYVPSAGEQIVVTADDHNLTNIFWLQTDPGVLAGQTGFYGAFSDYTDQFAGGSSTIGGAVANQAAPMRFTTTDEAFEVSIVNNSRITFAHTGVYNLQWSGQFENTDNAPHDVSIWLRKGGTGSVVGSNGLVSMSARKNALEFAHTLAGWNFVVTVNAGEYYEFMWSADSTLVSIQTYPVSILPDRPSTASTILTVTPVTRVQTGLPGVPGQASAAQEVIPVTLATDGMGVLLSSTAGKLIYNTTSQTVNVNGTTAFAIGQRVDLLRKNSGTFTVAAFSPATISGTPSLALRAQYSAASIVCTGVNEYVLVGDLG